MTEYTIRGSVEDPDTCDCCGHPAPLADFPAPRHIQRDCTEVRYCRVCGVTFLSNATDYPDQCPDRNLYKSIGRVTNMILDAIRENQEVPADLPPAVQWDCGCSVTIRSARTASESRELKHPEEFYIWKSPYYWTELGWSYKDPVLFPSLAEAWECFKKEILPNAKRL